MDLGRYGNIAAGVAAASINSASAIDRCTPSPPGEELVDGVVCGVSENPWIGGTRRWRVMFPWVSCQIRRIAGCASTGNASATFSPPPRISDSDMHHSTCVTHVPWCMLGSLTNSLLWSRWRSPQFYVSGKRPIAIPWPDILERISWLFTHSFIHSLTHHSFSRYLFTYTWNKWIFPFPHSVVFTNWEQFQHWCFFYQYTNCDCEKKTVLSL